MTLYLGFWEWNGHGTLAKAEHCLFFSFFGLAGLQDSGMCAATGKYLIAWRLSLLGFVFKPVSGLAGDSGLWQTFCLRIALVDQQSLSPISPSTMISYSQFLAASLSTRASRSITSPSVFSLDRNKPVTANITYVQQTVLLSTMRCFDHSLLYYWPNAKYQFLLSNKATFTKSTACDPLAPSTLAMRAAAMFGFGDRLL